MLLCFFIRACLFEHIQKLPWPRRAAVHSRSKRASDPRLSVHNSCCSGYIFWALQEQEGRVLRARGRPVAQHPHSEVQVTDWMYSGLVEMSPGSFYPEGEGRRETAGALTFPPAPSSRKEASQRRLPHST